MPLTAISMPVTILTRFMQWSSAVIHTIYQEVISTISVALFLPAFVSPFVPNLLSKFVTPIDIIFSYLWLTAFIFAAQDYNWKDCSQNAPPGASCALKKANESFMFLAL
ncbi:hypothetical protein EN45_062750 [Penicillium chrysogenum]|uniref:MARVEL domain-containing protein n=1 Tax=Penicillium chrysogenum TaxID=5076 RepID=A0A167SZD2_PENCH|nr:hypothetical protein EN45_062750 [Penicillium chrysogenum]